MKFTILNQARNLQASIDDAPARILFSEPAKERQVHRVLKSFVRHPVGASRLPFQGLVVPEPKLPELDRPYPKIDGSIKPDFVGFAESRVAIAELKVEFDENAVKQLVNQLTRLTTALRESPSRAELRAKVAKRVARTDLLFGAEVLREGAVEAAIDRCSDGTPLHGCLIVCDPSRPSWKRNGKRPGGRKTLRAWLQSDRQVPLWAFRRPGKRSLSDKAGMAISEASFDLLAASWVRVATAEVVGEAVCLWDARIIWQKATEVGTNQGWPIADVKFAVDGSIARSVDVPEALVGAAIQWIDGEKVFRSATWTSGNGTGPVAASSSL